MASDLFGFELLNNLHGQQIEKKEDIIVLLVHWALVKKGFRCLGIGDSVSDNFRIELDNFSVTET